MIIIENEHKRVQMKEGERNFMEVNRIQLIILSIMQKMNATNQVTSISIANIQESIQAIKSYSTLYRCMNLLYESGWINYGVKDGKFKTYYITQKGINKLKEMIKC